ncbi:uncharacterized protein RMCFA_1712 [Mycolicibacterium fortuitum subsp. acetamidolyticum]|uniref:Uncharacterized protein n=1 Tax=Mycolicibacterium fortuitum subsp. acetamidolyticum TaxID=144550 RepID=A0A124E403_MYCFO|nr:uncharacterized protein RMCFA_1712 [Mycolicibacterium fortuitum subsp. acetamidolyticum]
MHYPQAVGDESSTVFPTHVLKHVLSSNKVVGAELLKVRWRIHHTEAVVAPAHILAQQLRRKDVHAFEAIVESPTAADIDPPGSATPN